MVTYEEWLRTPEVSDAREEVVNGEIRITPAPEWSHSEIVMNLLNQIAPQVDRRGIKVAVAQFGLIIRCSPLTSRSPDLAIFERSTIVARDGYVHSAPCLIAEVLSISEKRQEQEQKLTDYAFLGVPEVWVASQEARTVEVLCLEEGRLRTAQILAEGILTPKHFPDVHVDISAIWRE